MRWAYLAIAVAGTIFAAYKVGQQHPKLETKSRSKGTVLYYVDPMHPSYKSDKPGIAPDCGMALQPVYAKQGSDSLNAGMAASVPEGTVSIDGATQRLLGIKVGEVEKLGTSRVIQAVGRVLPEDTRVYSINSGVDGFVRETYNDSVGMLVKKDQKLASYYSPDFLAAASGFLAANERIPGSVTKEGTKSIQNYTDRLRNLGMSDQQIKHVTETRQLPESIDVVAPANGFILARSVSPGQHFMRDTEFYRIADLSHVWISAEVSESEAANVHAGAMAQMTLKDGRKIQARVTDSLPQSEPGSGTVKFRLEAANSNFVLRPEMLVDVDLPVRVAPAITVPMDALVDSGTQQRIYVQRTDGNFEPREVATGWRTSERVQILQGVQPGERVVVSATFLVDSESRLKAPASAHSAQITDVAVKHVAMAHEMSAAGAGRGENE